MVLLTSLVTLGVELFFFLYLFDCAGSQLHHAGSSSLTRDRIQAPALGKQSYPLDHQGSHWSGRDFILGPREPNPQRVRAAI